MTKPELKNIPIELLKQGKYQTRRIFDLQALQELAESIKAEGLIQPIIVRPAWVNGKEDGYEIVAGERRWRAAQLIGIDVISCLVSCYTDEQAAAITPIENTQRENLSPIEEALAYQHLIEEFEYSHYEIAAAVGKSRPKITNLLRLLKLDTRVQEMLSSGGLSEAHGKNIAGLDYNLQYGIAKKSVAYGWSTRRVEREIKKLQLAKSSNILIKKNVNKGDPDVLALEKLISAQIGSEVKLEIDTDKKGSGWLKIRYFNNEILTGILDKLGIDCSS
jgi:ParB family transcriptional regulator, chromosome partitioning protein